MFRPAALAAGVALVLCSVVLAAQQAPVFRSSVDLVQLDVSVLNKDRIPVRGLTASDFTVLEDGKPQPIVAFSAVDVPDAEPPAAPWMKTHSPDVQTNAGIQNPEGRLFVLLMDDAMLPPSPAFTTSAKDIAKKFLDRVTPADRVAVVFSATGRNQDFTNDRARLVAAIDSMTTGQASHTLGWETARSLPPTDPTPCDQDAFGPKFDVDAQYRRASMTTLRGVAETLISAPQRRKALILVSSGIDLDPLSTAVQKTPCTRTSLKEMNGDLLRDMADLFLEMRRANVTIYPIDPGGLGGLESFVSATAESIPLLRTNTQPPPGFFNWYDPGPNLPRPRDVSLHVASMSLDFLREAAENTGGLAVVGTNDFDSGLDRIFKENGSYYVIGYQEPSGNKPGSTHVLKVRMNRTDLEVRTRSGYMTAAPPKGSKNASLDRASPLDASIAGAVPTGAFPMRVVLAPFALPGKKDPVVAIVLGLEQPAVEKRTAYGVELQTNAYTPDGRPKLIGRRDNAMVVLAPSGPKSRAQYDLLSTISLPPGRYELRISAHRALDNVDGSLYADVEIPDFAKAPLSVSGLMVETIPAGAAAPADAFDMFVPVVPTSNRTFRPNQEATAFMRIYQGGKDPLAPVSVKTTFVDRNDKTIGEASESVGPDRFHVGGRAADYKFPLPLAKLPPGPYLLTFEIAMGKSTVNRSVQFTVEK